MHLKINGKLYDVEAGVQKASLSTLYELKVRTGIGVKQLRDACLKFANFADPLDMLDDKAAFQAFRVIIWLARKHAGEKVGSLDEATDFPMDSVEFVLDEDELTAEEKAELDPKVTADSEAGASVAEPAK